LGMAFALDHVAEVPPVVAAWVVPSANEADCQVVPVQNWLSERRFRVKVVLFAFRPTLLAVLESAALPWNGAGTLAGEYVVPFVGDVTDAVTGAVASHVTVLSVEVETVLVLPARSETPPAGIVVTAVPGVVMPLTATLKVVPSFGAISVIAALFVPPAVPVMETSEPMNVEVLMGSLKTAV
jgi:hypothetical protein